MVAYISSKKSEFSAVVFDLYGTLLDTKSAAEACEEEYPGLGASVAETWRRKQLEYTWLRTLMGMYRNFEDITRDALIFALRVEGASYAVEQLQRLSSAYLHLKAFPDVFDALAALCKRARLAILSNGTEKMIRTSIANAGLQGLFEALISADKARIYKPHPSVYNLAVEILKIPDRDRILFVSSNAWDAAGAKAFGFTTVWLNRQAQGTFDELSLQPDYVIQNLKELRGIASS